MKIAIFSDIHDNINNLNEFFKEVKDIGVDRMLCLGDHNSPFIAKMISEEGIETKGVLGNNDGDIFNLMRFAGEDSCYSLVNNCYDAVEIDGKKIFMTHYPDLAHIVFNSDEFDLVCFGHSHKSVLEHKDASNSGKKQILLNPGEISGIVTGKVSFAVYDTEQNDVEIIEISSERCVIPNKDGFSNY